MKKEKKKQKKITDAQVYAACDSLDKATSAIQDAMKMAYALCREGDDRMLLLHIRGAFSGLNEAAKMADGFLAGLRVMYYDGLN